MRTLGRATESAGSGAPTLRLRIRRETADLHGRLEAGLGLLDPGLTIDRYRRVLVDFHGFYVPVEATLRQLAAGEPLGFPLRTRSELLECDLRVLGLSRREIAELPRCRDLPRLSSREDLAGSLYVLEGACLGEQVIARVLRARFGLTKESGASFFIGDAEATSERWLRVLHWLETMERGGARCVEIVTAARATFVTLANWVELQGASREE